MKFLLCLTFFIICIECSMPSQDTGGLYSNSKQVLILSDPNADEMFLGRNYATLVQFYLPYCPFSKRFAPTYKKLAAKLFPWRDVVFIAAINCAKEKNTCRKYKVKGVPSLRYFGPRYEFDKESLGENIATRNKETIASIIARNLLKQHPLEPHWPNFASLEESNPEGMFEGESNDLMYVIVLFEPENSVIGTQAILDFHKIKAVKIRRTTNAQVAENLGVKSNTIKVFQRNLDPILIELANVSRDTVKYAIKKFLADSHIANFDN